MATQQEIDARLKALNTIQTPAPKFNVNQADVRPTGTAFNSMQDLQRSSIQATGKPVDIPKSFDAGTLGSAPKPIVPEAQIQQISNPDATVGTATDYVTRFNKAQEQAAAAVPNTATLENTNLYNRLKDLYSKSTNKGTDLLAEQEKANVGGITKQIEEQNLLVQQKANQYQKNIASLPGQGRGITTGIISGQTDRERRLAAADVGAETAILQAMQGNLTLAKQTAQDAIDLKYKPIEDEIAQKLQLLELNAPQMNAEEKKRADITAGILQEQQQQIADRKQTENDISNVLAEAAKNGATQDVLQKIKTSTNLNDAILSAGSFISQNTNSELDKLLSPTEAQKLGVPYGTTRGQAIGGNTGIVTSGAVSKSTSNKPSTFQKTVPTVTETGEKINLSSRANTVYQNPSLLSNYTATEKGKILDELAKSGVDMSRFSVNNVNASQREQIAQFDDLIRQGQTSEQFLNDTGLDTGPIASRYQSAKSVIGQADPNFVQYKSMISNMASTLLRLRSGAAVSEQEFARLSGFIPDVNDDEKTAKEKINSFYSELDTSRTNFIKRTTQTSQQILDSAIKADPTNLRTKYEY